MSNSKNSSTQAAIDAFFKMEAPKAKVSVTSPLKHLVSLLFVVIFILSAFVYINYYLDGSKDANPISYAIPLLLMTGAVMAVSAILKTPEIRYTSDSGIDKNKLKEIEEKFESLKEEFDSFDLHQLYVGLGEGQSEAIHQVKMAIEAKGRDDFLRELKSDLEVSTAKVSLDLNFEQLIQRMVGVAESQNSKNSVNLIIGFSLTLIAFYILGTAVFNIGADSLANVLVAVLKQKENSSNDYWVGPLAAYIPRAGLAIAVELLALFFLRLYKRGLDEVRYLNNEITNIESRRIAISYAGTGYLPEAKAKLVEALASTERNFLLTKDQTTIGLEREKMERSSISELVSSVRELIKSKP